MKLFKCGLCKENKREWLNRYDLRKHLKEEHRIRSEITNKKIGVNNIKLEKRSWWIEKEYQKAGEDLK